MQAKVSKKEPYSLYPELEKKGVRIVWGDPAAASSAPSDEFDVVYDNNGKKLETCQPLIDKYKARKLRYPLQLLEWLLTCKIPKLLAGEFRQSQFRQIYATEQSTIEILSRCFLGQNFLSSSETSHNESYNVAFLGCHQSRPLCRIKPS